MSYSFSRSFSFLAAALLLCAQNPAEQSVSPAPPTAARELYVTVGKSLLVDSPTIIQRVSVANGGVAEAIATTPREVLVNGKAAGETSLIVWQENGNRLIFDLIVQASSAKVDNINRELRTEMGDQKVTISMDDGVPFLRGTVNDLMSADRAVLIASALGKPVNLLRVKVPPVEAQILIKVRFVDVDRTYSQQLGLNFFSNGATGTIGSVSTGQFTPPQPQLNSNGGASSTGTSSTAGQSTFSLTNALNIFFFRPDLNLGATIEALQAQSWLQILAEPNVLTLNNKTASFLAGGEFPFPTLQGGGAGLGAVTIQFREFGVRINFTPTVTPRGTIRLQVTPEVSTLDFTNGLTFQGTTIPGLSTRRVSTEIELESGQTFAIAGLLDNRVTEQLSKIPGLGDIPFFGRLFRSKNLQKTNSELLVIVTPEIVRPLPAGQKVPDLNFPRKFMAPNTPGVPMHTPGMETTGPVPVHPPQETIPVEQLIQLQRAPQPTNQQTAPVIQFVPMLTQPAPATPPATQPVSNPAQPTVPPANTPPTGAKP